MAARDDSVIRGSLIACMIFLVLSIACNFFFWRWGDTQAKLASDANSSLENANDELQVMEQKAELMRSMLGQGSLSDAEFTRMKETVGNDPVMAAIESQFVKDMTYLSGDDAENRNYPALAPYLAAALRDKNRLYEQAREESTQIRDEKIRDVDNARSLQKIAEDKRDEHAKKIVELDTKYTEDRARINREKEETRDALTKKAREFDQYRKVAAAEKVVLVQKSDRLQGTIDTQKVELNRLRSDKFETTQGEIRYVYRHGNVVTINLGSADQLRTGVTFGVIDGAETRLDDAKVKATIQITAIRGDHLAEGRVVARPEIQHPIIPGDKIYSPFWQPGRVVRIALAGNIDLDGDDKPDNEALRGMVTAAGAKVVAEVSPTGQESGTLDASVRFLVIGEDPSLSDNPNVAAQQAQAIAQMGDLKNRATELGVSIIPAWKLQNYLKIMNDSLTTPLGSAAREADFAPLPNRGATRQQPSTLPKIYREDQSGIQKDNKILPP